jgi:hypothetical protein
VQEQYLSERREDDEKITDDTNSGVLCYTVWGKCSYMASAAERIFCCGKQEIGETAQTKIKKNSQRKIPKTV